jgi:hypothetical protein
MPLTLQILLYALVAAFSPIVLVTTLTVLLSGRGRLNGVAFAVGFLAAQAIVCGVGFAIGAASTSGPISGKTAILGVVEVVLGVALLGVAWRQHRHPELHRTPRPRPRLEAMKAKLDLAARLRHLRPGLSLSLGLLFGVGLKRLLITLLAVAQINVASRLAIEEAALIVLYIAVASIPVLVPVGTYVVAGRRAEGWVQATKAWLTEHQNDLGLYSTAVVGLMFVIDGVTRFV